MKTLLSGSCCQCANGLANDSFLILKIGQRLLPNPNGLAKGYFLEDPHKLAVRARPHGWPCSDLVAYNVIQKQSWDMLCACHSFH